MIEKFQEKIKEYTKVIWIVKDFEMIFLNLFKY